MKPTRLCIFPLFLFFAFLLNAPALPAQTPDFTVTPTTLGFSNQVLQTTSAAKTVTLKNTSASTVTFSLTPPTGYAAADNCAETIAPGAKCMVSVTFTPPVLGAQPGALLITEISPNAASAPVNLTGTGVPATAILPTSLAFGNVGEDSSSAAKTLKLTNNQDIPLNNIAANSPNSDYSVTPAATGGCSTVLAARSSCSFNVVFTPHTGGAEPETLTITSDAVTSPNAVSITGTGTTPISLVPAKASFPTQIVGTTSAAHNLTLKNNQSTPLSTINISISPTGDFSASGCGAPLAGNSSCVIAVTFTPQGPGTRTATLSVTSPDAQNLTVTSTLSGPAKPPVTISPASPSITFAGTGVGLQSAAKVITLTNNQTSDLTFAALTLTPSTDFMVQSQTCGTSGQTLPAGESCTYTLVFTPSQVGNRGGTFSIGDNTTTSPHLVYLNGVGTKPVSVAPTRLPFATQYVSSTSPLKQVVVTNHQDIADPITETVTGPFVAHDDCGGVIPAATGLAGGTCNVWVGFAPTSAVASTGTLSITESDGGTTLPVTLTGTGTNTPPKAVILTVAPGAGQLGTAVNVTISGANTHWDNTSVPNFGTGIALTSIACPTSTLCTATANISSTAAPGARTVKVTTGTEVASLNPGFAVSSSLGLTFTSISPNSAPQGTQNLTVNLVGNGSQWMQGVTYGNFGDGITLNGGITVTDSTHASANITISPYANIGWRMVTLVTGGEFVISGSQGFQITGDNASIVSVSPNTGAQGQNVLGVTVVGLGTHFLPGATMVSLGGGINVGAVNVLSPTLLKFDVAVSPGATPGAYPINVSTGGETESMGNAFTVTLATPSLNTVTPSSMAQCATGDVAITGILTDFVDNPTSVTFGSDITQTAPLTVNSKTSITAHLSVSCTAYTGGRTGDVTSGGSDYYFSFNVTPSDAKIISVAPPGGPQGGSVSITVTGFDTHWVQGTTTAAFYPIPGFPSVIVNRVTIQSNTVAVLDLSIPSGALVGANGFYMATGGEVVSSSFAVSAATPTLTMSPNSSQPGHNLSVTFTGQFTHFNCDPNAGPVTLASITGAGLSFAANPGNSATPLTCSSPEQATALLQVAATAAAGTYSVTLTTGEEVVKTSFSVVTTPATLLSISPYHSPVMTGVPVTITGLYTHFQQGVTTLSFGPGITVEANSLTITSPTQLSAVIDITSAAAYGWRSAFVNTGSEELSISFLVDAPGAPMITSVSPSSGEQGQSGFDVTVTGANTHWQQGLTEFIMGAGITVLNTTVTDQTHATLTLAISFTAPVGGNGGTAITNYTIYGNEGTTQVQEVATGQGFTVVTGAASENISVELNPPRAAQNQTLTVLLTGTGTHWLQGETTARFDSGIATDLLTVIDPTHARLQMTVLSTASLGFHTLTVSTDGEVVTLPQALDVEAGTPVLLSTTPNEAQQGATLNIQILGDFTHFDSTSIANFGSGVIVNSFTAQDSVTAVANITVDPLAYVSPYAGRPYDCNAVTVTTGTEQETLAYQFCIDPGPAVITSVSPGSALQGATLNVNVVGQNTHFRSGLTTANFGSNINVGNVVVTDTTHATISIGVASNAPTGLHDVTLTTLGENATLAQAFQVGAGSAPTLNGVAPFQGEQGQSFTHAKVFGQFTHWTQATPNVNFGEGITVSNLNVQDDQTLFVDLAINPLAQVGGRTVTVTTQLTGGAEIVSANAFTVLTGPATLATVAPISANQGQQIALQLTGDQTNWQQGLTQFYMSGLTSDITLNSFVINSKTSATALITISPTAGLGARSVYMTTGGEALTDSNAFVVTGGIPSLAFISPNSTQPGTTNLNVSIGGLYTKWLTGTVTADFGPGIIVQSLTVNNDTNLTAVINVDGAATIGSRTVTVRDGTQALLGTFFVQAPPSPYIWYYTPTSALTGQTLTISLNGAYTKWDPNPSTGTMFDMGSDIQVNNFQVTSQTTALANITIPLTATIGVHTITLTTGSETEQVPFTVVDSTSGAVQTLQIVDPGSGMQGASLTVNVIGQYTLFDNTTVFNFGPGITVGTPVILGPTIANVPITIDQLATLGGRSVTATTNGTTVGGAGFTVTPSTAVITAVNPNTANQGVTLNNVAVTGSNTHWDASTTFSFGGGITASNTSVIDNQDATITIAIDPYAAIGGYNLTAQTGGEIASMKNAFVVTPGTPVILSSAPSSGQQQSGVTFTILGQVTNWNGTTTVAYSNGVTPNAITINSVDVTSPTSITAQGTISATAPTGYYSLAVATGNQVLTYNNVFYVTSGPASISTVSPSMSNQGATLNVEVSGLNTNFNQAYTLATFGSVTGPDGQPAITVNSVTVNSPTDAIVNITIDPYAPPQYYAVTMTTLGEVASSTATGFQVVQSTPVLNYINPASVAQGATTNVTVTGLFTNWNGTTTFNFGDPLITVNSVSGVTANSATVNLTVSPIATIGPRTVTATTGTHVDGSTTSLFAVSAGPAVIASVTPNTGRQNANGLQVTLTGNNTHFTLGTPVVSLGSGVTVTNVVVTNDTALQATVNIDPNAAIQSNNVTVQTGGEIATLAGGFTVTQGAPILTTVNGSPVHQGDNGVNLTFTGQYTHFVQGTTTVGFDSGFTVNSVTVNGSTSVTVNVNVANNATLGMHTVTITTGSEVVMNSSLVTVTTAAAYISALSQTSAQQGQTFTLTITGSNTHFAQSSSSVSFYSNVYGYGSIGTSNVTVASPTSLTVQVNVNTGTPIGQYTVSVTTNSETASDATPFNITAGTPGITVVSPNYGSPGQNGLHVDVSGNFLGFQPGVTTVSFGSGITVTGVTVNNANDLTATINIGSGATVGPRDVVVTTNATTATASSAFSVLSCTSSGPTLLYASPMSNVSNVPINATVSLEFNKPLDRTTVTTTNFVVEDATLGYSVIPGSVSVDVTGRVVTFTPATVLPVGHQIYVYGNPLKDGCGNTSSGASYYFYTSFSPQGGGPSLVAANIENGDINIGTNAAVELEFSEAINPITALTSVTLTQGSTPVIGQFSFSSDSTIAYFTPASNLAANTSYTVTYTAQLMDEAGNALSNPGSFSFTTGAGTVTSGPTAVSTSPVSGATGVGTNTTLSVKFNKELNPVFLNTGNFYLVDNYTGYIVPTTISVSADRLTATLTPDQALKTQTYYYFHIYAQDAEFNYGTYANYYFTTGGSSDTSPETVAQISPANGATGVPVNAVVSALMSKPVNPLSVNSSSIQVMQGATPVAGTVALQSDDLTVTFTPSAALTTSATYNVTVSGVTDQDGNVVTASNSSFTTSSSSTPVTGQFGPVSTSPTSGQTGVSTTAPVTLVWPRYINPATVNTSTFQVYYSIAGTWVYAAGGYSVAPDTTNPANCDVTFTPSSPYPQNATIYVYTYYMYDYAGNNAYTSYSFQTGAGSDSTPLQVVSVTPPNNASNIGRSAQVVVTFNKSVNRASISTNTGAGGTRNVQMYNGDTPLNPGVSFSSDNRSIVLSAGVLPASSTITVVLTHTITDVYGNALADYSSQFTTETDNRTANSPNAVEIRPANGASEVSPNTAITLYLNYPVDPSTISAGFHVSQNGVIVAGTATAAANGYAIQFTPNAPFNLGALVQVFMNGNLLTVDETAFPSNYWQFRIMPDPSATPPSVIAANPAYNSQNVPLNTTLQIEFDEAIDPATVNNSNLSLTSSCVGGNLLSSATLDSTHRLLTLTPNVTIAAGCYYYTNVYSGLHNTQGLGQNISSPIYFYAGTGNQTSPPIVTAFAPPNGASNIGTNAHIGITFSGPIDPITANSSTVQVNGGSSIPVSIFFDSTNTNMTLYPQAPLPASTSIMLALTGLQDIAGNVLATRTMMFTTAAGPDTSTGYVVSTSVDNTPTNVPINAIFTVRLSKPVDPRSVVVGQSHIYLYDYTTSQYPLPETASLSPDNQTLTVVPTQALPIGRQFQLGIDNLYDMDGAVFQNATRNFYTAYSASSTAPQIIATNPSSGATNVPVNTILQAQFNEPVRPDKLTGVSLKQGTNPVAASISLDSTLQVLTVVPSVPMNPSTSYKLTISGVQDTIGNNQSGSATVNFTTATGADLNGPVIQNYSPASGESGVGTNAIIQVLMSEPINPVSLNINSLQVRRQIDSAIVPAALSMSSDHMTLTLTPNSPLQGNTQYQVLISYYQYLTDIAGNNSNYAAYSFTTAAGSVSSETINAISPPNGAIGVPINSLIVAVASNPIDPLTVNNNIFNVTCGGYTAAGAVSLASDQVTLTFTPAGGSLPQSVSPSPSLGANPDPGLSCSGTYTVSISGFSDVNGNPVTPFTSTFSRSSSSTPVTSGPTLAASTPPNGAVGQSVTAPITLSYNGAQIDPLTVNHSDFEVYDVTSNIILAGTYSVAPIGNPPTGSTVTFTPAENYKAGAKVGYYTCNGGMKDYAGNQASGCINYQFTVANTADTTSPQVIAVSPANGTQNVGQSAAVTLTFNKSVIPNTVTSPQNVALYNGPSRLSVGLTMSSDNSSVTVTNGNLPVGATITVVVSSGIQDISGNAMTPFSSTFTVTSEANADQPTIVSQRPVNGASLVPSTATLTLFSSNPMNTATVSGALHVSQNGLTVPGTVNTTASGQAIEFTPGTAFAPGSLIQVFLDHTAIDVNGNPLASTYSSSFTIAPDPTATGPSVIAVSPAYNTQNIPINAKVFQIQYNEPLNPATVNSSTVTLYNNSTGYMTGYSVSLDPTNTIITVTPPSGNLLPHVYYYVGTSSGIQNTSGLASLSTSWQVYFYTGTASDGTTPVVNTVIPTDTSTGIGVNARAVVTFNKLVSSISGALQLLQGGSPVKAEITLLTSGTTPSQMAITPYAPLTANTTYTVSVTGVQDAEGNTAPTKTTTFTTGPGVDLTPPVPVASNFGSSCGYCGVVPTNIVLYWRFNKPIASGTVTGSTVYLTDQPGNVIPATTTVSADGMTVTLKPNSNLTASYNYYHAYITGVTDLDGNVLNPSLNAGSIDLNGNCQSFCNFEFATGTGPDTTRPTVQLVTPGNGLTGVPLNAVIEVQLSKPLSSASFGGVTLNNGSANLPATVSYGANQQTILIQPSSLLAANTTYTVTLSGVTDMVGNSLASAYSWSFTTGNSTALATPTVTAFTPSSGATGVSLSTTAKITYSAPINPISVNPTSYVYLWNSSAGVIAATYSYSADRKTITITPTSTLAADTLYYIYAYYVQDLAGNQSGAYSSSFTTGP